MNKRSLLSSIHWQAVFVFFLFVILFGIAGTMDREDQEREYAFYCEMVSIWQADADRGVPAHDRAGWPPYNGPCHE